MITEKPSIHWPNEPQTPQILYPYGGTSVCLCSLLAMPSCAKKKIHIYWCLHVASVLVSEERRSVTQGRQDLDTINPCS